MKFDHYEFAVCEHFLCALINGDVSGLDDHEAAQLEAFESCVLELVRTKGCESGHWSIDDNGPYFGPCDIMERHGTVQDIRYMFPITE